MADESPKPVIEASRSEDPSCIPEHIENKIKQRIGMTLGGLIVVIGGVAIAVIGMFHDPVEIKIIALGMGSGLIGAGAVDPSMVMNYFKRGN